jgi:Zn-dependent metallo-hydrolase RNA specificity domain
LLRHPAEPGVDITEATIQVRKSPGRELTDALNLGANLLLYGKPCVPSKRVDSPERKPKSHKASSASKCVRNRTRSHGEPTVPDTSDTSAVYPFSARMRADVDNPIICPKCQPLTTRQQPIAARAKRLKCSRHIVMLRRTLMRDCQRAGVEPTAEDAFNFSMWRGYLSDSCHAEALEWCRAAGAEIAYIHTSGHASPADLRAFAAALRPKAVVPVNGIKWDEEAHGFGIARHLAGAELMVVQ